MFLWDSVLRILKHRKTSILLSAGLLISAAIVVCGFSILQKEHSPQNYIANGFLDLTSKDFGKTETIQLNGEWEFYWNSFLNHEDLQEAKPDMYIQVPGIWSKSSMNGQRLPGQGFATYRVHIKTGLPENALLGLRIYTFSSAYQLYINDSLVASNGVIGKSAEEEIGEYRPQAVFFNIPESDFDITVQVSNFHYARGGFWYRMDLGSAEAVNNLHNRIMEKEAFLLGVLAIISLFFLTIFFLLREQKYTLYFACLCMVMAVAVDMLGQFILLRVFPNISFEFVVFLWYSSSIWVFYFLMLFLHELFKSKFSGVAVRVYLVVTATFQLIYLLTNTVFYTGSLAQVSDSIGIAGALCSIVVVGIGINRGQKDGWIDIASIGIALIAYIHDNLFWMNIINPGYGEIIYLGLFIFIFFQMAIQAKRIKKFHEQKTAAELSFLQAQIKPHFLYNALNTFVSISLYDIDKARKLIIEFGNYLRRTFDFKDFSQLAPLKNELELVRAYLEIEKARFEERIEVVYNLTDDLETKVPILVLQPIVENAVIHGILPKQEGGRIEIYVQRDKTALYIRVKDNGVGMDPDKKILINQHQLKSGVGLLNINNRLKKLYGKGLQITSRPGRGTEVTLCIPLTARRLNKK